MSSHLLVSSASGPATAFSRTGGSSAASSSENGSGAFAALLGGHAGGGSGETSAPGTLKTAIENLIGTKVTGLEFESGALIGVQLAGQEETLTLADLALQTGVDLKALTALEAGESASGNGEAAKLLAGLAGLLANIGDPPDEETLTEIGETIDALAAVLDLPLTQSLTPEQLAGIGARQLVEGASLADKLKGALADIAGKLIAGADGPESLPAEIGNKLGAFIAALENAGAESDLFAKLGFATATQSADANLKAAIAALLAKPGGKTTTEAQQAPETTEPQLRPAAATGNEQAERTPATERNADPRPKHAEAAARPAPINDDPAAKPAETSANAAALASGTRIDIAPGAKPVVTGYQTSQQQLNLPQIAFEIVRQVHQGHSQFQIRLDPPQLGRIDVRMDIDTSGNVNARLTVEKAETLDLMQRDQRALERALAQAGLDSSRTNLEFSLKQNPFAGQGQDQQNGNSRDPVFNLDMAAEAEESPAPAVTLYRGALSASGVNIFV